MRDPESRIDWTIDLRSRLATLRLSPAREAEIVEELSQHLDERYQELRNAGTGEAEARGLALEELCDVDTLAHHMRRLRQAHVPTPIPQGGPRRGFLLGYLPRPAVRGAHAAEAARICRCRCTDAGPRHRREYRDLQPRERDSAAAVAGREPRTPHLHQPRQLYREFLVSDVRRAPRWQSFPGRRGGLGQHHYQPERGQHHRPRQRRHRHRQSLQRARRDGGARTASVARRRRDAGSASGGR